MQRHEAPQAWNEPAGAQRGQHGQVEQAVGAGKRHGLLRAGRQLLQHGLHIGRVDAACVGQHHALAHAVKEGGAQLLLQLANLARHRALRQVQLFSRPRDAGVPGSRLKGQQVGNRRQKGLAEHGGAALGLMMRGNELAALRAHRFGALALAI